jgi:hypothetical protein
VSLVWNSISEYKTSGSKFCKMDVIGYLGAKILRNWSRLCPWNVSDLFCTYFNFFYLDLTWGTQLYPSSEALNFQELLGDRFFNLLENFSSWRSWLGCRSWSRQFESTSFPRRRRTTLAAVSWRFNLFHRLAPEHYYLNMCAGRLVVGRADLIKVFLRDLSISGFAHYR